MGKKLLLLNNSQRRVLAGRPDERFRACNLEVEERRAAEDDFPDRLDGYAGAFLSGSPHSAYDDVSWIRTEHELIRELAERGIPVLGVCFGCQILASALCGRDQVVRRATCEVGFTSIEFEESTAGDPLRHGMRERVRMFVWHNDDVRGPHPDMTVLARSPDAPVHIWRYRDRPVWGVLGHPEVNRAQAQIWFEEIRPVLERDGADVERLKADADDTEDAKRLLTNFARIVAGG